MRRELHVELFRFDSKVDYLPYYKRYKVDYKEDETVLELLDKLNSIEKFGYEEHPDFNVKINNIFLNSKELVKSIVEATSSDFVIEPISIYRAVDDLIVNKKDHLERIEEFRDYLSTDEIQKYVKEYELDFYASNTYNINRDYIGDPSLLIASTIIEEKPELTGEMLKKVSDKESGIFYHTSLENRVYGYDRGKEYKIKSLLNMLSEINPFGVSGDYIVNYHKGKISQHFKGFNIASFEGVNRNTYTSMIKRSEANYIDLDYKNEDLAPYSTLVSKDFSLKIAGTILLEAKDKNADFIIVRNENDILLFDGEQKRIEKAVGREIDLPVISQEQFLQLIQGEKDISLLGFDTHRIKVSFL